MPNEFEDVLHRAARGVGRGLTLAPFREDEQLMDIGKRALRGVGRGLTFGPLRDVLKKKRRRRKIVRAFADEFPGDV